MSALSPGLEATVFRNAVILSLVAWGALALGCSGGGDLERRLDDYARELGEVTRIGGDRSPTESGQLDAPLYPEPRTRRLEVEEIRVTPLSALSLRRCSLLSLVGERNSVLGRIQSASGRLRYEAMFVAAASACAEAEQSEGRGDAALAEQLREVIAVKARDLPAVFWNATFGSNEAARHFGAGGAGSAMRVGPADEEEMLAAWQTLAELAESLQEGGPQQWQPLAERLEAGELDASLETLLGQTRGGTLRALALVASRLDAASDVLAETHRLHGCGGAAEAPSREQLQEIEQRFWQGDLRPQSEALLARAESWLWAVDRAWREVSALAPDSVTEYQSRWLSFGEGSAIEDLRAALLRHEEVWRKLSAGCGTLSSEPLS